MRQTALYFPSLRGLFTRSNLLRNKIGLLVCLLCFASCVFSQVVQPAYINPLDAKNGINKFKLCSFFDLHKANLKEILNQKDTKVKWYTYTGNDVDSVFEYKIKQISLGYYKNKLYKIIVLFDTTQGIKTDDIKNKLDLLFGKGKQTENNPSDKSKTTRYFWESTKVYLSFEFNEKEISIYTHSKIMEKLIISDEL